MFRYDPRFSLPISNAIGYPKFYSRSQDAVIRVYDEAGKLIAKRTSTRAISKTHEFFLAARRPSR
jgi:hypothetical protein